MGGNPFHVWVTRSLLGAVRRRAGLLFGLLIAFGLGRLSGRSTEPPPIETDATRNARALVRSLDELEARLTESSSWVVEQTDLKQRHEGVSALACASAVAHLHDMSRIAEAHQRRLSRLTDRDDDGAEPPLQPEPRSLAGRRFASARPAPGAPTTDR
jgi:hypothetical protein